MAEVVDLEVQRAYEWGCGNPPYKGKEAIESMLDASDVCEHMLRRIEGWLRRTYRAFKASGTALNYPAWAADQLQQGRPFSTSPGGPSCITWR